MIKRKISPKVKPFHLALVTSDLNDDMLMGLADQSTMGNKFPVLIKTLSNNIYFYGKDHLNAWKLTKLDNRILPIVKFPERINQPYLISKDRINPEVYKEINSKKTNLIESTRLASARFFDIPFATDGDVLAIPDAPQMDGSVSYTEGFTENYEEDLLTDPSALPIPRDQFNQLMNDITLAIQQYQVDGFFYYQSGWTYDVYAIVRYNSGSGDNLYQSLIDSNTDLPTVTSSWRLLENGIAPSAAYCASVYMSTSSAPSTISKLAFDTVNFDDTGIFDNVNLRFVLNKPGYWRFSAYISVAQTGSSSYQLSMNLYKNSSNFSALDSNVLNGFGQVVGLSGSKLAYANGLTDYFEIYADTSGQSIEALNSTMTYFEAEFIGTRPLLIGKYK
jgi:hypothetical protein